MTKNIHRKRRFVSNVLLSCTQQNLVWLQTTLKKNKTKNFQDIFFFLILIWFIDFILFYFFPEIRHPNYHYHITNVTTIIIPCLDTGNTFFFERRRFPCLLYFLCFNTRWELCSFLVHEGVPLWAALKGTSGSGVTGRSPTSAVVYK